MTFEIVMCILLSLVKAFKKINNFKDHDGRNDINVTVIFVILVK